MKRSEFNARLTELFGDEDIEIYVDTQGTDLYTGSFNIFIDSDGDAVIEP